MKALALLSGGLDSTLAIKVVQDQGISVSAVNFSSPFCRCDGAGNCKKKARVVSEQLGIDLKVVGTGEEYLEIVRHPRFGYGKNMNPCIDCRIMMLKKAAVMMQEIGASFLITGEVLGQRPMSQNRQSMDRIEKESGLAGLIVRPLSARFFDPTIPEKEGWLDREKLLDISGRSRKPQMDLAERFHLTGYGCPAGGCLLTDPNVAERIRDLVDADMLTMDTVAVLRYGRYFSLSRSAKLILGRSQPENEALAKAAGKKDTVLVPTEKGPTGLIKGTAAEAELEKALTIVASHCKTENPAVDIECRQGPDGTVTVMAGTRTGIDACRTMMVGAR